MKDAWLAEIFENPDAAAWLARWPDGVPEEAARWVLGATASALAPITAAGQVHGGLRPASLRFSAGKLVLAPMEAGDSTASLPWAAPEVFSGERSPKLDIYAFGCTAYALLTGRPPFEGEVAALVAAHLAEAPDIPAEVAEDLRALILGCMEKDATRRWGLPAVLAALGGVSAPSPTRAAPMPPEPRPAPPPKLPPPPVILGDPTPLDGALRRHLRTNGDRWDQGEVWRAFMVKAEPAAREHGLSERDLIRRAAALVSVVASEQAAENRLNDQLRAWVTGLGGPRWTALGWAGLLDALAEEHPRLDEAGLGRRRDAMIARHYPAGPGATRVLELPAGLSHLLVYQPAEALLARPGSAIATALSSAAPLRGLWFSAAAVTVREWAALTGQPAAPELAPNSAALATHPEADALMIAARRQFPLDDLRWPTLAEYDGLRPLRPAGPPQPDARETQLRIAAARRRPGTLGGALLSALGGVATDLLSGVNEAWLSDVESGQRRGGARTMTLLSPLPRAAP